MLVNEGDNILVPCPGFPLYQVIAESLEHMASLVDSNTRAIVLTNPSNPCGSNYSAEHLEGVAAVAR